MSDNSGITREIMRDLINAPLEAVVNKALALKKSGDISDKDLKKAVHIALLNAAARSSSICAEEFGIQSPEAIEQFAWVSALDFMRSLKHAMNDLVAARAVVASGIDPVIQHVAEACAAVGISKIDLTIEE